ncbi:MAG: hypothetical protein ACYDDB_01175 [bacterium]
MKFIDYIMKKHEENKLSRQEYLTIRISFFKNEKSILKTMQFISDEFSEYTAGKLNRIIEKYLEGK